jgi:hypothetical protein
MSICFVVDYEKQIYETKDLTKEKVLEIAKKANKKHFDRSEDTLSILNVPHIYSWETSGYYHGYGLAQLIVYQWREYFYKKYGHIVDNKKVGKEIQKIWTYASLYPAKQLVKMATGKALSPDSYIKAVTKPMDEVLASAKSKIEKLKKVPVFNKKINLKGKIIMMHGKKKIADNTKSFEEMDRK